MELNLATTVSFCAASTCASLAALGAYLGRRDESRHFRYPALAGFAGAVYCLTDAILAGQCSPQVTVWAGRFGLHAACVHAAAWLAFLAAWDKRRQTPFERAAIRASLVASVAALIPGVAVENRVVERVSPLFGITYRDPVPAPLAVPIILLCYVAQVAAAVAAIRMTRHQPRARVVSIALGVFCLVIPLDTLSSLHVLDLPYLADPAVALILLSIGAVVVMDAGESIAKSAELQRARVALAERENLAALGQLAAVVAHEVRNPVAIIFSALATLRRPPRDKDDEHLLGIVGEEAERLRQLVTRLLDAVRPFELQYSRRLARDVLASAIAQVTTSAGVAPEEVQLQDAPTEEVECDEILFGQAIANLVQNALVATGRRSPVRVHARVDGSVVPAMLRIEISDDGDGVSAEAQPLLFTPFYTTRATGTGLGLALVRRIAGAHGGTVVYAPGDDGGAHFHLCIPLRADGATAQRLIGVDLG